MIAPGAVAAVLLAAGGSSRFGGGDKLLAPLAGEPLVAHPARAIAALAPARRVAVCRDASSETARLLGGLGFEILLNPDPASGLSRSLGCGIGALGEESQAALVCLADMPFVTAGHLSALLARFDARRAPIVASAAAGVVSPPALFARTLFAELQAGSGDQGARRLLRRAVAVAASIAELRDIDRPQDLRPS